MTSASSAFLLQICFTATCSNALFLHDNYPLNANKAAASAARRLASTRPRAASPAWKSRGQLRRSRSAPGKASLHRRRRSATFLYGPDPLFKTSSLVLHSSQFSHSSGLGKLALPRKAVPTTPPSMDHVVPLQGSLEEVMMGDIDRAAISTTESDPRTLAGGRCGGAVSSRGGGGDGATPNSIRASQDPRTPPQQQHASADECDTRSSRSCSTASRNTNRLSLTLPIAPPTAYPSRPTPASATMPSYPPTPSDAATAHTSYLSMDSNDFIIAIAAQERRVLELRDALTDAEEDLRKLRKLWTVHEGRIKRTGMAGGGEALLPPHGANNKPDGFARIDEMHEKRKALLRNQQSQQDTTDAEKGRRRVFKGRHARTLSLLSPRKADAVFSEHEGKVPAADDYDATRINRYAPITPAQLSKRSSWAPRSTQQASGGVKQIAEEFKAGFWNVMEDLRQAAIGEEPITGQARTSKPRGTGTGGPRISHGRPKSLAVDLSGRARALGDDQETIKASGISARPRLQSAFDHTPTPASRTSDTLKTQERDGNSSKRTLSTVSSPSCSTKRFSWTPLTMDALDDADWASWDAASASTKSPSRWSGSTASGDLIQAVAKVQDESDAGMTKYASSITSTASSLTRPSTPTSGCGTTTTSKLEELLSPALNRLSLNPGTLTRKANDLMTEWEKSLSPPPPPPALSAAADADNDDDMMGNEMGA